MTTEKQFDLDGGKDDAAKKPVGQPTPPQPLTEKLPADPPPAAKPPGPGFSVDPTPATLAGEVAAPKQPRRRLKRPAEREPTGRSGRAGRGPTGGKPPRSRKDGMFFLFRPVFLLLLGAILLSVLWGGGFFAHTDEAKTVWPWELFIVDGAFNFQWTADHIETLLGAFFVVFFLFTALTPARAGRGVAVLTVAALGLMLKPPSTDDYAVYVGYVLLALGVASVLQHAGLRGGQGGRPFVFVMVILLAASLFFPAATSGNGYDAEALRVWGELTDGGSLADALEAGSNQVVILQAVVLLAALLALLGMGSGWMVWVVGITLYVAVFAPLTLAAIDYLGEEGEFACLKLHQALVMTLPAAFLAFVLPTVAGGVDAARDPIHR